MRFDKGLRQDIETMHSSGMDSLLVTDADGKFLGVANLQTIQAELEKKTDLKEVVTETPLVRENDKVSAVVKEMLEKDFRFVPVVDNLQKVKGIITRSCIVNFVLKYF